jgi:hypothetical protein
MMVSLQVTTQKESEDRSLVTVLDALAVSTVTKLFKFFNLFHSTHEISRTEIYLPIYSAFIASKVKMFWSLEKKKLEFFVGVRE